MERFGFRFVNQRGSHMKYSNGTKSVIIPNHTEVARGTLKVYLTWPILRWMIF